MDQDRPLPLYRHELEEPNKALVVVMRPDLSGGFTMAELSALPNDDLVEELATAGSWLGVDGATYLREFVQNGPAFVIESDEEPLVDQPSDAHIARYRLAQRDLSVAPSASSASSQQIYLKMKHLRGRHDTAAKPQTGQAGNGRHSKK